MTIAILGAGNIGLYLGGRLLQSGAKIQFFGRKRMGEVISKHGLKLKDNNQVSYHFSSSQVSYCDDKTSLMSASIILLTVKATQIETVLLDYAAYINPDAKIICMQNGVNIKDNVQRILVNNTIIDGMVMFNVIETESFEFYQSTSGSIVIENAISKELIHLFKKSFEDFILTNNITGYKWSKLLLNLNNSINALSGLPLKNELSLRPYRVILAQCIKEALLIIKAKKIKLEKLTPVHPNLLPLVLSLNDILFKLIAKKMINIDPLAKSSMLIDIQKGNLTEVNFLNGAIADEGTKLNISTPTNSKITDLIHKLERKEISSYFENPKSLLSYLNVSFL